MGKKMPLPPWPGVRQSGSQITIVIELRDNTTTPIVAQYRSRPFQVDKMRGAATLRGTTKRCRLSVPIGIEPPGIHTFQAIGIIEDEVLALPCGLRCHSAMQLPLSAPPQSVCVLRLSAIGDICHTLPVIRTLQIAWPKTKFTWIIGRIEAGLIGDIPGIEFIIFDKSQGWRAYVSLFKKLRGRHFDVLLHMQIALRASVASLLVRARIRLGFDKSRAKDYQWLFTNARIAASHHQHVMDGLFGFAEALGVTDRVLNWDIPQPETAVAKIAGLVESNKPLLVISPCSSDRRKNWRDWSAERYADVADHAAGSLGLQVALTGGPSQRERDMGDAIARHCQTPPLNFIGKTTLKELLVLIDRAAAIVTPDSGPAHIATTVGTPVIGLYVTSNPLRTGPYLSQEWVINHYPAALAEEMGKSVEEVRWGSRVRNPNAMQRISVQEVLDTLDKLVRPQLDTGN